MLAMLDAGHDLPLCRAVAGKLVGDHDTGRPHLLLQQLAQQPLGRLLVASALDQNIKHDTGLVPLLLLIRGPRRQPMPAAADD